MLCFSVFIYVLLWSFRMFILYGPPHTRGGIAAVAGQRALDRLQAHPVRAVGVGEIACGEDHRRAQLLQQVGDDPDVRLHDGVLPHLPVR